MGMMKLQPARRTAAKRRTGRRVEAMKGSIGGGRKKRKPPSHWKPGGLEGSLQRLSLDKQIKRRRFNRRLICMSRRATPFHGPGKSWPIGQAGASLPGSTQTGHVLSRQGKAKDVASATPLHGPGKSWPIGKAGAPLPGGTQTGHFRSRQDPKRGGIESRNTGGFYPAARNNR